MAELAPVPENLLEEDRIVHGHSAAWDHEYYFLQRHADLHGVVEDQKRLRPKMVDPSERSYRVGDVIDDVSLLLLLFCRGGIR